MMNYKKSIKAFRYVIYVIKISLRSLHFNITLIQLFINTHTFQRWWWWWWCSDEFYIFTAEVCTGKKSPGGNISSGRQIEWMSGLPLIAIHMHIYTTTTFHSLYCHDEFFMKWNCVHDPLRWTLWRWLQFIVFIFFFYFYLMELDRLFFPDHDDDGNVIEE